MVKAENENKNLRSSVNKTAETKPGAHTKVRIPKSKANSVGAVSGNKGQVKGSKVDSKGRRLRVIPPRIYPNGAKNVTANFNYNNNFSHIPRAINPPTYPPTDNLDIRNYHWLRYLRGYDYNGKRRSYRSKPAAYPDPSQVTDPRLKMIGAMGQQQGTQYAWGGGHGGSKPGPSLGQIDSNGGYDDRNIMGMDCAGLVRYGYYEATRADCMPDWNTNRIYAYFNNPAKGEIVGNLNDSHTLSKIRPGDIILIGQYPNTTHVEVYAGNGTIVQTNQSQTSANFSELAHGTQEATVFRPKAFKG